MPTSEPLHVAFVWHMHQPFYRSPLTGAFDMPWVRMHALKDYADMVLTLSAYPDLHHTFNLVPSLVEQLQTYASGDYEDVYWDHTLKPAAELTTVERAFLVERMCERPDHPRAKAFPRYLELARKREACAPLGWTACANCFTVDELRDMQIWFNLAWFDPQTVENGPLAGLLTQGQGFAEEDKQPLAQVQADILAATLPAYQDAAARGQIELTTSPYFHPILPLLANTDAARVAAPDTLLPPRRFAHPEDAREQIRLALEKHREVFGRTPDGMWCSEQAVGEDVLPLLMEAAIRWTISDETVLARSISGAAPLALVERPQLSRPGGLPAAEGTPLYAPYRLEREGKEVAMVFRDHTLSDLLGFAYQSWNSRDAANDLLRRLREIRDSAQTQDRCAAGEGPALVTIALDGENAWEYYPRDGRDFLNYLYEGLSADDSLRCVTVSEHLAEHPPVRSLGWLHTGSWIGGDLRTWSGDKAHNAAWGLLHEARDLAASRGAHAGTQRQGAVGVADGAAAAWSHVLVAEGSDWFWWFGDHHHTELDYVWDLNFRLHLQAIYRALGEPLPVELFFPILPQAPETRAVGPRGPVTPRIDGVFTTPEEWQLAGTLQPELPSTMQPAQVTRIDEIRFGWSGTSLSLLLVPSQGATLEGLEVEVRVTRPGLPDDPVLLATLEEGGHVGVSCTEGTSLAGTAEAAWRDVLEMSLPLTAAHVQAAATIGLMVRVGRRGLTEHAFHSASTASA